MRSALTFESAELECPSSFFVLRSENNHFLSKGFEGVDTSTSFRVFGASKFEVLKIYPPKLGLGIGANVLGDPVLDQLLVTFWKRLP